MSTMARSGSASQPARIGALDAIGRRIVHGALDRLRVGRVVLDDRGVRRSFGDPSSDRVFLVRIRSNDFYRRVALGGALGASESFMDAWWDCDDLAGLFALLIENRAAMERVSSGIGPWIGALASRIGYALQANSRIGSRRNIAAHYDLSNAFFGLWLDPGMTYSCGVFGSPDATLEEAQREKIDRACRKLDLRESDHLLEIGTGWGSAAIHAAREYGCRVTTTTISDQQHAYAEDRVRGLGLGDRITLLKSDYRDLTGRYDKVLSIEMIEAVGRRYLDAFFGAVGDRLAPDGLALIQAITIREAHWARASRQRDFLKKYIFPGSCLLSHAAMNRSMSRTGDLRVLDVEDLGPHYAETLRRWRSAFEDRIEDVRSLGFDGRFCRMWRYYFEYCEGAFEARHCSVSQILMDRSLARRAPIGDRSRR